MENTSYREKNEHLILRVLYMVLYWFALKISLIGVGIITIVQLIFRVVKGEAHSMLTQWGSRLALYMAAIVDYLTFKSEEKPWPFLDFPEEKE